MMVLVDTSVWSLFLRRQSRHLSPEQARAKQELAELITEGLAQIIGPIRQELLSGIREEAQYRASRHPGRTLTNSSRKIFVPRMRSISCRAAVPIFFSVSPCRPMMIFFCPS